MSTGQWVVWSGIAVTAVLAGVYACWPQYLMGVLLIVALAVTLTFGALVSRRTARAETAAHATGFGPRS